MSAYDKNQTPPPPTLHGNHLYKQDNHYRLFIITDFKNSVYFWARKEK
jgi:hypothetical protein